MTLVSVENVFFRRREDTILAGIDWKMQAGQHWLILGPNGSGKSTLAALISASSWPSSGTIRALGETYGRVNLREFRKRLGIFQPAVFANFPLHHPALTALEIIALGAEGNLALYRDIPPWDLEKARELFRNFFERGESRSSIKPDRPFRLLSSGEQRRVLLLRSLMADPELLLLDEPYESLDIGARILLENMLESYIQSSGAGLIIIVHRLEETPSFTTHSLLLKGGRIEFQGPAPDVLTSANLSRLYDAPLFVGRENGRWYWTPGESRPEARI